MKEWTPNSRYGGHAFGFAADAEKKLSQFDVFLAEREKILPWIKEYSPYELVTSDDPPIGLYYGAPPAMGQDTEGPDAHRQLRRRPAREVQSGRRRVPPRLSGCIRREAPGHRGLSDRPAEGRQVTPE